METQRPNPDALLAHVKADPSSARRGRLRIFFGYAAGVGKTFAMLQAAQEALHQGRDVVVGYVEPHARPETQALVTGLEVLPVRELAYRGVALRELDLDAALQRHPEVLLVDELAHTNAQECRHEKRWLDVEELLDAGIEVWTTLNVQHIESLNDVVGEITGVVVRETVPDRIFDLADELELVDLTPDDLRQRLLAGKVYLPDQAKRAIDQFFQKGNLAALREMALRQTARRVHSDVESARQLRSSAKTWATSERILVCVGPSPTTARVIRIAKRMATALDAHWVAVSVDLDGADAASRAQQQVAAHFRLAERLGAETVTLAGQDVASTILEFGRSRNATKILIGKTDQPRWKRLIFGSVVDQLLEQSGSIDIDVISGAEESVGNESIVGTKRSSNSLRPMLFGTVAVVSAALIASTFRYLRLADSEANTSMLFLATVAWVGFRWGRGPAILASLLSVLLFDFLFVPPFFTFAVADAQYLVTFAVMLAIGLVISTLTSRLKAQVESTRLRERRTAALYELGRQLSSMYGPTFLLQATASKIHELVQGEVAIYLSQADGVVQLCFGQQEPWALHPASQQAAQWACDHEQLAGAGTNTLPNAPALFVPLIGSLTRLGAIGVAVKNPERLFAPETRQVLQACASQLALSLERDRMAIEAADAKIHAETEQVRSSLLSSVSHDLRTPLAVIAGASSSLIQSNTLDAATRQQLLETVAEESLRLNHLLENILQMSKLEAGGATPNKQWHVVEELIGSSLHRSRQRLANHVVDLDIPSDLPLVLVDGLLMEQVLVNLLENAAKYTPSGTRLVIRVRAEGDRLRMTLADDGPGLPVGAESKIFEKFYRAHDAADSARGSGLGLAICRAIVLAHGGQITAANRATGGAEFTIMLPLSTDAPKINSSES